MGATKSIPMLNPTAEIALSKNARYRPFGGKRRPSFARYSPLRTKSLVTFDEGQDSILNALLLSACLETETASASTGSTRGLSAFTYAMLTAIATLGTSITSSEMIVEATEELRRIGILQTPQIKEPELPAKAAELEFPRLEPHVVSKDFATGARAKLLSPSSRPVPVDPALMLAKAVLNALTGMSPQQ